MSRLKDPAVPDEVPVRDLKARLSAHLRAVQEGRELTVTAHGQPIARLVPTAGPRAALSVREPVVREPLGRVPRPLLKRRVSAAHLRRIMDADREG